MDMTYSETQMPLFPDVNPMSEKSWWKTGQSKPNTDCDIINMHTAGSAWLATTLPSETTTMIFPRHEPHQRFFETGPRPSFLRSWFTCLVDTMDWMGCFLFVQINRTIWAITPDFILIKQNLPSDIITHLISNPAMHVIFWLSDIACCLVHLINVYHSNCIINRCNNACLLKRRYSCIYVFSKCPKMSWWTSPFEHFLLETSTKFPLLATSAKKKRRSMSIAEFAVWLVS